MEEEGTELNHSHRRPRPCPTPGGFESPGPHGKRSQAGLHTLPQAREAEPGEQERPNLPGVRAGAHPSERLLHGAPAQGPEVGCSEQQDAPYPRGPDLEAQELRVRASSLQYWHRLPPLKPQRARGSCLAFFTPRRGIERPIHHLPQNRVRSDQRPLRGLWCRRCGSEILDQSRGSASPKQAQSSLKVLITPAPYRLTV